jgi:hypothetical protein
MNKQLITILYLLISFPAFAQQGRTIVGRSHTVQIVYKKESLITKTDSVPGLEINYFKITDDNRNLIIEPGEKISFEFWLKNSGTADARDIISKLSLLNNETRDFRVLDTDTISNISAGVTKEITGILGGLGGSGYNSIKIMIEAYEMAGRGVSPVEIEILDHKIPEFIDLKTDSAKMVKSSIFPDTTGIKPIDKK